MNKLMFEFTEEEINTIVQAIAKQPYETVFGLINKIQQQAQSQLVPQVPKAITTENMKAPVKTAAKKSPVKKITRKTVKKVK